MLKFLPFIFTLLSYFFLKLNGLGIRISDANIYWYNGYLLNQGKILYKEIPFANFPLFAYISSFYNMITGGSLKLFFLTPTIEVIIIANLIFYITYHSRKKYFEAYLASILYLFSFIILSTSDHQTGVFSASLFAVLSYLFLQKKHFGFSAFFLALTFLTKAYFLPVVLASFFFISYEKIKLKEKITFYLVFSFAVLILLLPSLFQAPSQFLGNIFGFSLTRPQGLSKSGIAWFFMLHDFILFILLVFNIANIRRNIFFGILSLGGILFFFLYKDVYYLYLNFLVPFICLSLPEFLFFIRKKVKIQTAVIPIIIGVFLLYNIVLYISSFQGLQRIEKIDEIVKIIKKENPSYLYGPNTIIPALLYLTNTPPLEGIFDAHPYFFREKKYDKKILTDKALSSKTIIVTNGIYYPAQIDEKILDDEIIDKDRVKKSCNIIGSFPIYAEGITNRINIFKCY